MSFAGSIRGHDIYKILWTPIKYKDLYFKKDHRTKAVE